MDQTDQKRARSKFFSVDVWRVFGPPSGKKKEIWFMLKHGQNSRFNFHIIEKLSAPWWLRWKERNLFDPMGFLWDVYWPHWPSLVQIRGPPWVRHESLAPRISVKLFHCHFTVLYISNRFFILMTARVNACGQKMHLKLVLAACCLTNSVLLASLTWWD